MTKTRSYTKGPGVLGAALLLAVGVLGAVFAASPAGATLPGANGKIAYANGGIWVAGPGGENPTRLTSSIMDADPSWSPDGKRIAFTRLNGCQNPECVFGDVWVMHADGTDGSFVTKGFNPSWSPDGERLAYESCATSGFYPLKAVNNPAPQPAVTLATFVTEAGNPGAQNTTGPIPVQGTASDIRGLEEDRIEAQRQGDG